MTTFNESDITRVPAGLGENGGEFTGRVATPADVALEVAPKPVSDAVIARYEAARAEAARIAAAATSEAHTLSKALLTYQVRNIWPDAAEASFFARFDNDDIPFLDMVRDRDGGVLWHDGEDTAPESLQDVNTLAATFGPEVHNYLTPVEGDDEGFEYALDLTGPVDDQLRWDVSKSVDVENMDWRTATHLHYELGTRLGDPLGWAGKSEVEYRVAEDPGHYGIAAGTAEQLDDIFKDRGGRDAWLTAIVESKAWSDLEDKANDAVTEQFTVAVQDAVKELIDE